jgi:N-acetylglucosaminyl-diphospho-decaprenol L-rhamnosyltransferase
VEPDGNGEQGAARPRCACPPLAVVTVTRSPGEALDRFLDSLKAATTRPMRVVLADTGSTDGAPERAAERDGVTLLRIGEDVGRGAAVNRAVAGLGPEVEWVAVADPELEWGEGALDALLAAAERRPRAGVLGPLVRDPDGAVRASAWELPPARALPALAAAAGGRPPVASPAVEGTVGWLSGSCLLMRRAAWESVDGFDPRYVGAFDDVDLGDRLARAGWLSVHVPSAEVVLAGRPEVGAPEGRRRYLRDRHARPLRAALALVAGLRTRRDGT